MLTVKNTPASAGDVQVRSLGQEDPLEEDMAAHSSVLAWRIPMDRGACWATVLKSREELGTTEVTSMHCEITEHPKTQWHFLSLNFCKLGIQVWWG